GGAGNRRLITSWWEVEVDEFVAIGSHACINMVMAQARGRAVPGNPGLIAELPEYLTEGRTRERDAGWGRDDEVHVALLVGQAGSVLPADRDLERSDDVGRGRNRRHGISR